MRVSSVILALAGLAGMPMLLPPPAWAQEESGQPGGVFEAEFERSLGQAGDLMLQGIHATSHVAFTTPRTWEVVGDPTLRVRFEHSAALVPARSHLNVFVNGRALGTVRLDEGNTTGGTLELRVPRRMLVEEYNDITLDVEQHYTEDCEDPFDPALWTRVTKNSSVLIPYARKAVQPDLVEWPVPFFDRFGYGPTRFTLVGANAPSSETVEAAGLVALSMGRLAAWRGVQWDAPVATVAEAKSDAFLVGTVAEVPEIASLLGDVVLGEDQGMVAVLPNPSDPTLAVLVVTGGGTSGLEKAAAALSGQDRYQVLSGARAKVSDVVSNRPPPTRQAPLPAPHADSFALEDLRIEGVTVRGYYPATTRIPLRLEGDALLRPGGGRVRLDYAYSAQLDTRLSAMEVRLGRLSLRSVPLAKVEGDDHGSVTINIPEDLVDPETPFDVVFHLFPRDFDACEHISDRQIWATIYPSSTFDLPRDHLAQVPDLGRLRYGTWPFTLEGDDGVVAVLPNAPTPTAFAAGLALAAEMGRTSVADSPDFRLALAGATSFGTSKDDHAILLVDDSPHALYDELAAAGRLATVGGPTRELRDSVRQLLLGAEVGTPYSTIEEVLHPQDDRRAVLVVRAPRDARLAEIVDFVTDDGKVKYLDGNLAVITDADSVRTLDVADKKEWGQLSVSTAAQIGVRRNWWAIGLAVIGAALVFTAVVRQWVRAQSDAR